VLRLDRLRALVDVYPGVEREDEMVAAFDYCLHGKGGAAPSIDTAMHGLVDAAHVDHLHPDSGIALATAADGEALTRSASATGGVGAVAAARASSSAWTSPRSSEANPQAIGCILGGHGITAWGDTSEECEANSLEIIRTAERSSPSAARPSRSARRSPGYEPLPEAERRAGPPRWRR
jgi:rhamnose utilization protein RhaD (predicted bifunctional aldolase and dehydrogenase)